MPEEKGEGGKANGLSDELKGEPMTGFFLLHKSASLDVVDYNKRKKKQKTTRPGGEKATTS